MKSNTTSTKDLEGSSVVVVVGVACWRNELSLGWVCCISGTTRPGQSSGTTRMGLPGVSALAEGLFRGFTVAEWLASPSLARYPIVVHSMSGIWNTGSSK